MRGMPVGNVRTMALATFANTIGSGLWMAGVALYLTRHVGLSATQVGAGLSISALVGLTASVPLGHLADRRDPRLLRVMIQLSQAVVAASYLLVHSFWPFLLVATLDALLISGNLAVRAALVAAVGGPAERVQVFAVLHVTASLGISVGAALAALLLTAGSYPAMAVLNSLTYLISAGLLLRLPAFPPVQVQGQVREWKALRDLHFLAVSGSSAVLALHRPVLVLLVPLWIAQRTTAPHAAISAVLVVNTAASMLVMTRVSRATKTAETAAKALRHSGMALGAGMLLYAFAAGPSSRGWAVATLVLATVIYTLGDVLHANATTSLAYELAAPGALGQYQGANQLVTGLAFAVGPILLSVLVLDQPSAIGWLGLAILFAVTGWVVPSLVRRARAAQEPSGSAVRL